MVNINRINPDDPGTLKKIIDRVAALEKQVREIPDTLPPERGIAQITRQGYMSPDQVVALNAATTKLAGITTTITTDANGWEVRYDPSGKRRWLKRFLNVATTAANAQNVVIGGAFPVAVATASLVDIHYAGRCNALAALVNFTLQGNEATTALTINAARIDGSLLNAGGATTLDVVVEMTER